jgi:hypothetical protein
MYIIRFYNSSNENPMGTGWNRIIRLKTIKGVKNRIAASHIPQAAVSYSIFKDIGHGKRQEFFMQNINIKGV